jgi:hypothetical protein
MDRKHVISILIGCVMTLSTAWAAEEGELTHDGLALVEGSDADVKYVLPEADFAVYNGFILLEPVVAFRRNWQREVNRAAGRLSGRVSDGDMEQIKSEVAELFRDVFAEQLEGGGFAVVEEPGEDVMILRPAIVNLDIAVPDAASTSAGRSRAYAANAGSASLFIELHDSVTGQILARAVDSRRARSSPGFEWVTAASNRADARRVLSTWAEMLVESLNDVRERVASREVD